VQAHRASGFGHWFAELAVEAGLSGTSLHRLRHTVATSFASGVPPKVAAEQVGHADATLFTSLYSHVTPTMQREAAEIGAVLLVSNPASLEWVGWQPVVARPAAPRRVRSILLMWELSS
jgi:hypothetical protein